MPQPPPLILTDDAIEPISRSLLLEAKAGADRFVLGIAGIAASGKSTLAERLADTINRQEPEAAAFIPMDGFHLPNRALEARGWKRRKGAPFTYDAMAYISLLNRYRKRDNRGSFPVYCREAHEPVTSSRKVTGDTQIIVTEGQYLLSTKAPWAELADVLEVCWWLDVSPAHARRWLMQRDTAVGRSPEETEAKYQLNDRINTDFVLANRRPPDRVMRWPDAGSAA